MTEAHAVDEFAPPTAVLPCSHVWVRKGLATGTSEGTTLWGPTTCVLCGAADSGREVQSDG